MPPDGVTFKQISVGKVGIWALDAAGRLSVRKEINETFPEGSHWQLLSNIPNDPPHYDGTCGFKNVSVGEHVYAVSESGCVCFRSGITPLNPAGTGWIIGIQVSMSSVRILFLFEVSILFVSICRLIGIMSMPLGFTIRA